MGGRYLSGCSPAESLSENDLSKTKDMSLKNRTSFLRKTTFGAVVIASLVSFTVTKAEDDDNDADDSSNASKSEYIPLTQARAAF
jgi:hypothetical protein